MIRARVSELELHDLGEEIWDELQPRAEAAVAKGVDVIIGATKENLSRRRGSRRTAAPAGESPELDEGELRDAVKPGKVRRTRYGVRQEYEVDHPGAALHEFGGTVLQDGRRRRYPPRPYVRPAEDRTRAEVDRILEDL